MVDFRRRVAEFSHSMGAVKKCRVRAFVMPGTRNSTCDAFILIILHDPKCLVHLIHWELLVTMVFGIRLPFQPDAGSF